MRVVQIEQNHSKSDAEVKEILLDVEKELKARFGLATDWKNSQTVSFKRSGVKGALRMKPGNVSINMKLGLVLGLYSRTIQTELKKTLAEKLA